MNLIDDTLLLDNKHRMMMNSSNSDEQSTTMSGANRTIRARNTAVGGSNISAGATAECKHANDITANAAR